ncbi:MAG: hypothetical protein ACRD4B_03265 [Acidobacteriota bacterium]
MSKLWALARTYDKQIGYFLIGLFLFALGWQVGRLTSPYTSAQPIVFEDRECSACSSSGGGEEKLQALLHQGSSAEEGSAVAGTTAEQGEFVASMNSDLYHHTSCPAARRIKEENKVWFTSATEAEGAGYEPSVCASEYNK